jgi:hypothetical protein
MLHSQDKANKFTRVLFLIITLCVSLKLFFSGNSLPQSFESNSVDWYLNFSKEIFHPGYFLKGAYFTESMLLPLLANSLGAAKSMVAYKLFCSLLTIAILPLLAILALRFFHSTLQSALLVLLTTLGYAYLYNFSLGFPDPLTIILLLACALERHPPKLLLWICLACLCHFSLALISIVCLLVILIGAPDLTPPERRKMALYILLGLIAGRSLLYTWFWAFDYHPISRLSWALDLGLDHFTQKYQTNMMSFWLTPGKLFLGVYFGVLFYLMLMRQWLLVVGSLAALLLAYAALFFTVDGYRIFAVIIAAPYIFLLRQFIYILFTKFLKIPANSRAV